MEHSANNPASLAKGWTEAIFFSVRMALKETRAFKVA